MSGPEANVECPVIESFESSDNTKFTKSKEDVGRAIGTAFLSPDFADIHLVTGTKTFLAHKVILAARSPVFAAMLRSNDVVKNNIEINKEFFEGDVEAMLEFIYTGATSKTKCIDLFRLSVIYGLVDLQTECEEFLASNVTVKNAFKVLILADSHKATILKAATIRFISDNKKDVIETKSYKKLAPSHPQLLMELYAA